MFYIISLDLDGSAENTEAQRGPVTCPRPRGWDGSQTPHDLYVPAGQLRDPQTRASCPKLALPSRLLSVALPSASGIISLPSR